MGIYPSTTVTNEVRGYVNFRSYTDDGFVYMECSEFPSIDRYWYLQPPSVGSSSPQPTRPSRQVEFGNVRIAPFMHLLQILQKVRVGFQPYSFLLPWAELETLAPILRQTIE